MAKLSSERVWEIFGDCLFREGEDTSNHIRAEGIMTNVGFHPERLESHRVAIEEMLSELPNEFKQSGGGGWTFLNACNDKKGNQWTGEHRVVEQLFLLGIAIDKVKFQLPREVWSALPGGMPYLVVAK
jgi:hypothetical protein